MGAGTAIGAVVPLAAATTATATAAQAAPRPIPVPEAARRSLRGGRLLVERTEFRLNSLAVSWQGPAAQVRWRTANGWSAWTTVVEDCAGGRGDVATGAEERTRSARLSAPAAEGYEVWVAGEGTAQVTELGTVDASASALAVAAPADSMPLPGGGSCPVPYFSRAAWGADESLRFDPDTGDELFPPTYYPVQTITVHHEGGGVNNHPDPAGTIRTIYYDQTITKDWGDIGYHLVIDEAGRVYEGRWTGTDGVPVFGGVPGPDGRPQMATAAHAEGWNSGNIGICLLGDFTSQLPTAAAREALTTVLASLARVCQLDPRAVVNFVNPVSGATRTVQSIPGHRDWNVTQCPGDLFYPQLPSLREDVAARLQTGIPRRPTGPGTGTGPIPRR
ncbi:peptidoglycan recognition family protein [Micromonospora sp. NPDC049559]|uniref:peptidoglycan recognition protein family protein n=1 Tax=Micromonospora sp. NPDC049559 TaxID=3155923 RepID=UPI0034382295